MVIFKSNNYTCKGYVDKLTPIAIHFVNKSFIIKLLANLALTDLLWRTTNWIQVNYLKTACEQLNCDFLVIIHGVEVQLLNSCTFLGNLLSCTYILICHL